MADKVEEVPTFPNPPFQVLDPSVLRFLSGQIRVLTSVFSRYGFRLNRVLPKDGSEAMRGPMVLKTYLVAALPTAGDFTQGLIYVSDETGGAIPAFSDGTNWRRVSDRAIVA